jgi:5-methylcytosine-specific restriction endonuclease McrA
MCYKDGSKTVGGKCYRQSKEYRRMILERDNYTCQICGRPGKDVDHIIPFALGGLSIPTNQRVLCHKCNVNLRRPRKDRRLDPDEYYAKLEAELAASKQMVAC